MEMKLRNSMDFDEKLVFGQIGENYIARWLKERGNGVLPIYEKEIDNGKGPRYFIKNKEIIAPDFLAIGINGTCWIEAKHKTFFSWHRITKRWVTGIDLKHYDNYLEIMQITPFPVWLLFLHIKPNSPEGICPTGLYGGSLTRLHQSENHRSNKWGSSGMVYWAENILTKLATLEEVLVM